MYSNDILIIHISIEWVQFFISGSHKYGAADTYTPPPMMLEVNWQPVAQPHTTHKHLVKQCSYRNVHIYIYANTYEKTIIIKNIWN